MPMARRPDKSGEITQDMTMLPRPPLKLQFRQLGLLATRETPTTPPMMACVVETGIEVKVASNRKHAAPISAANMPTA
jgi:hypothetical protein